MTTPGKQKILMRPGVGETTESALTCERFFRNGAHHEPKSLSLLYPALLQDPGESIPWPRTREETPRERGQEA
jgi:hypothetical protein